MSRTIASGHLRVSEQTFRRLSPAEMDGLNHSILALQREIRAEHATSTDPLAIQARARQLQRLRHTLMMLSTYRKKFKK